MRMLYCLSSSVHVHMCEPIRTIKALNGIRTLLFFLSLSSSLFFLLTYFSSQSISYYPISGYNRNRILIFAHTIRQIKAYT